MAENKASPAQITAFTHVAREKSFTKAAGVLGVTQSSVTQHISNLETLIGTQLFLRRREGLEMTAPARELFDLSDRLRTLEERIAERIGDFSNIKSGHLRIIANAPRPALPTIAQYGALYPNVRIEFALVSWKKAMQQLKNREVDIAIIVVPDTIPDLHTHFLEKTQYRAFMRKDHRLAGQDKVSLKEMQTETVIVPEDGSLTQILLHQKSKSLGYSFPRLIKTATFPVVKEAVLHGVGIGLMLSEGQYPSTSLHAVPILEMAESYDTCLVTSRDKKDLRLVKSFMDVAIDASFRTKSDTNSG